MLQSERSKRLQSEADLIASQQELNALKHDLDLLKQRDKTPVRSLAFIEPSFSVANIHILRMPICTRTMHVYVSRNSPALCASDVII